MGKRKNDCSKRNANIGRSLMCLDIIEQQLRLPDGFGYKVFRYENRKMLCPYAWCKPKTNKWINAKYFQPQETKYDSKTGQVHGLAWANKYKPGWHIYQNLNDAKRDVANHSARVIRKVKYRNARVLGRSEMNNYIVIVADEIRILEEV